jgi:hypothetical protein
MTADPSAGLDTGIPLANAGWKPTGSNPSGSDWFRARQAIADAAPIRSAEASDVVSGVERVCRGTANHD